MHLFFQHVEDETSLLNTYKSTETSFPFLFNLIFVA